MTSSITTSDAEYCHGVCIVICIVMGTAIMLNVIILNVMAPFKHGPGALEIFPHKSPTQLCLYMLCTSMLIYAKLM